MAPNEQQINNNNTIYLQGQTDTKKVLSEDGEFIVKHKGKTYDIKPFLRNHPGGINYVQPYQNKSITNKLNEHSQSAKYLLKEYQVGGREPISKNVQQDEEDDEEDLEKLVDWSKPLLYQVSSLGERYNDWVASPVDRQIKLFENPILEKLSVSPWYIIPIVWIPVIIYFLSHGMQQYSAHVENVSYLTVIGCVLFGAVLWTLIEYSIHRWVFHVRPSGKSKTLITIHFLLHGLHHKMPFDSRRLVFPPAPAALLFLAFYQIYSYTMPEHLTFLIGAGSIMGYLTYDMIHFYLHYGAPKENTFLYSMKRYHNQHHFVHHNSGYGISNRFWDDIFNTAITLPNLSKALRW